MLRRCARHLSVHSIFAEGCVQQRLVALRGSTAIGVQLTPLLHIASRSFYDQVLGQLAAAAVRCGARNSAAALFLKEGVAVTSSERQTEITEIAELVRNSTLAREVERLTLTNALFTSATLGEMCDSYCIPRDLLLQQPTDAGVATAMALQTAYFAPLLAARFAAHIVLSDVVVEEELVDTREAPLDIPHGTPLTQILEMEFIKGRREQRCVETVRRALGEVAPGSEVHILWGHHHTAGLLQRLQAYDSDSGWEIVGWHSGAAEPHRAALFGGTAAAQVPYGLTDAVKALLARSSV